MSYWIQIILLRFNLIKIKWNSAICNFINEISIQSIDDMEEEEKIILEKSLELKIDKDTIVDEEFEESTNFKSNSIDFNLNLSKKLELDMNGNMWTSCWKMNQNSESVGILYKV